MASPDRDEFRILEGTYGPRLELRMAWSPAVAEAIARRGIKELELNDGKGWRGKNAAFLGKTKGLEALEIIAFGMDDVSDIHELHNLKRLKVFTYCRTPIDFSAFPHLESVSLEWRAKSRSIFKAPTLRDVFINNYTGASLAPFAQLERLESLRFKSPRIREIGDLSPLRKLRVLALVNATRLPSLDGLEVLTTLEHLEVNHCRRITSIEPIGHLAEVRHLEIWDNRKIDTLRPLLSLKKLEGLYFYESTSIVDGDVALLKQLPRLRDTSFQNRRHYNCTREELWRYLSQRTAGQTRG